MIVSLLTYNILDGAQGREKLVQNILSAYRPTIVLLQEVMSAELLTNLANALRMNAFLARGNSKRHIGILSKFPLTVENSHHPWPPIYTTILEATVEVPGKTKIALFGIHLLAHPAFPLELWRTWETRVILDRMKKYAALPRVLAGDFNAVAPQDRVIKRYMPMYLKGMLLLQGMHFFRLALAQIQGAGLTDCYRFTHPGDDGFTLPTPSPTIRLDYVFASSWMKEHLVSCEVVREPAEVNQASDHYPILAKFEL